MFWFYVISIAIGFVAGLVLGALDHAQILPIYTWIINAGNAVIGFFQMIIKKLSGK